MKLRHLVSAFALALFTTLAIAGNTQPAPITVTLNADGSGSASGDMITARFAENEFEFIGCGIRIYDDGAGGTYQWGFCQVADSTDTRGFCSTMRTDLLDIMKATSDYSFITFAWNADGECNHIGFSTQSFYIPEKPDTAPGRSGR